MCSGVSSAMDIIISRQVAHSKPEWTKCGQVFYLNVSSLPAHIDQVREFVERKRPLTLMMSETCPTIIKLNVKDINPFVTIRNRYTLEDSKC